MEKWFVYVLQSEKGGKHYVGISGNLQHHLELHNEGKTNSTKARRPFKLIYTEEYDTLQETRKKEKYYKSGSGREKLKNLFPGGSIGRAAGC